MTMRRRLLACIFALLALPLAAVGASLSAQAPAKVDAAQNVSSVKSSPPPPANPLGFPARAEIRIEPGPTLNARQATLRDLVLRVHRLQPFQLAGGPEWFD